MFPYHRLWNLLLWQMDRYGIINMCIHYIWVHVIAYTSRGVRHNQVCTRLDSEGDKTCLSTCPARGSNPGSSALNSDALTTELRPPIKSSFLFIWDNSTGKVQRATQWVTSYTRWLTEHHSGILAGCEGTTSQQTLWRMNKSLSVCNTEHRLIKLYSACVCVFSVCCVCV